MNDSKKELLVDFSKHVPKLLHHQLINDQAHQYIKSEEKDDSTSILTPSVQRFHGALLFVDISGFTVLSQKLDVESLKNQINGYFSKIIEVVDRWGGDVIKFAGDAIYVVWRTSTKPLSTESHTLRNSTSKGASAGARGSQSGSLASVRTSMFSSSQNQQFRNAAAEATEKAVRCGLEICEVCGNYPVPLDNKVVAVSREPVKLHQKITSLVSSIAAKIINSSSSSGGSFAPSPDSVTYLNVHCGVSVGLMAGLDVGYEDRWEYFLVGDPLADVAKAESAAEKGDVVISSAAHELYHNQERFPPNSHNSKSRTGTMPCGCKIVDDNCYKLHVASMSSLRSSSSESGREKNKVRRSRTTASLDNMRLLDNLANEIKSALSLITTSLKQEYVSAAAVYVREHHIKNPNELTVEQKIKLIEKQLPSFILSHVRRHFSQWLELRLMDHLARHVHDVARADYCMSSGVALTFRALLFDFLSAPNWQTGTRISVDFDQKKQLKPLSHAINSSAVAPTGEGQEANELDDVFDPEIIFKSEVSLSSKERLNSKVEAELRTVTIMFIKIEKFDMSLLIDMSRCKEGKRPVFNRFDSIFGFLERTENEQIADKLMLDQVQRCLKVLHQCIYSNGGQLRQFIVDDKGTVGIASFGLRGSVNEDNAAKAIEAANSIIEGLDLQELTSSIGITTGKVYCGLVGSMSRHEFAIMGPSVNLSARLMSKAEPDSILCDQETMVRDRTHEFKHLGEVQAKGYSHPVATFRPIFVDDDVHSELTRGMSFSTLTPFINRVASRLKSSSGDFSSASSLPAISVVPKKSFFSYHPNKKLEKLFTSEFLVTDEPVVLAQEATVGVNPDSLRQNNGDFQPLRGRNREIEECLQFLFAEAGVETFLGNLDAPSRMVALIGSSGFGKTAISSAIARKLLSLARADPSININVVRNRTKPIVNPTSSTICKPILMEILRLAKKVMDTSADSKASIRKGAALQMSARRVLARVDPQQEYTSVVETIFKQLPESAQSLKQIILDILELSPRTDSDKNDQANSTSLKKITVAPQIKTPHNADQYKAAMLLIMNFCVSFSKKILLVVLDDVHTFNGISMDVLKHLWSHGKGIHFLVTANPSSQQQNSPTAIAGAPVTPKAKTASTKPTASSSFDLFGFFRNHSRFDEIVLEPLSPEAALNIIRDIVPKDISSIVIEQLASASGGNPMYMTQLAKTIAEEGTEILGANHERAAADMTHLAKMCRRVEEIICFRLDRLEILSQTILKAATVCALNGRAFTPNLITFVIRRQMKHLTHSIVLEASSSSVHTSSHSNPNSSHLPNIPMLSDPFLLLRDVVAREMTAMYRRGDFIQVCYDFSASATSTTGTPTMAAGLTVRSGDESDVTSECCPIDFDFDKIDGDLPYEFQIPTEQSTIYALIIDEQREFFHGKVAQFFHEKWNLCQTANASSSPNCVSPLSKQSASSTPIHRTEDNQAKTLSKEQQQKQQDIMSRLQEDVKEIAFHAEQAGLWAVSMRAFMYAAELELSLERSTQTRMSLLLDAFHIFKCCEQDSEETITPFSDLSQMLFLTDASPNAIVPTEGGEPHSDEVNILEKVLLSDTSLPLEDIVILNHRFEKELECVYNIFGNDTSSMLLAAELHLHMADVYMHSMNVHEQEAIVPAVLGIVLKLFIAIRLCITLDNTHVRGSFNSDDEFFLPGHSKSMNTREIDRHYVARFLVDYLIMLFTSKKTTAIDHVSFTKLERMLEEIRPFLESLPITYANSAMKFVDSSNLKASNHKTGSLAYHSVRLIAYLRQGDLCKAVQIWQQAPIVTSLAEVKQYVLAMGNEYTLMTTTKLLHHLTARCFEIQAKRKPTEKDAVELQQVLKSIEECIARCRQQLSLWFERNSHCHRHYYQHLVMSLLPSLGALVCLERWDVLDEWFAVLTEAQSLQQNVQNMSNIVVPVINTKPTAVAPQSHSLSATNAGIQEEFLAPPRTCVKHLHRWYLATKAVMSSSSSLSLPSSFPSFGDFEESIAYFQAAYLPTISGQPALEDVLATAAPSKTVIVYLRFYGLAPEMLVKWLLLLLLHIYPSSSSNGGGAFTSTSLTSKSTAIAKISGVGSDSQSDVTFPETNDYVLAPEEASQSINNPTSATIEAVAPAPAVTLSSHITSILQKKVDRSRPLQTISAKNNNPNE